MDIRTILAKIITLIYRTRLISNLDNDDLIRTILNTIKVDLPEFNFSGNNIVRNIKELCIKLLEEKEYISKEILIQQLSIILENDQKLLDIIKESILLDHDESSNKRIITSYIKSLNNYYREYTAIEILSRVSYDLKFNRSKISNFNDYLKNVISELEPLTISLNTIKDPALVSEIDFSTPETVNTVFEEVKKINSNTGIYKLGWQSINKMLQGGIRRGETIGISALQHKYKTSITLSIFIQIALNNLPIVTKEEKETNKKPLLLRISFEDSLVNNLQFMYQYLKTLDGEFISQKDFINISSSEMTEFIINKLTINGFNIKMRRIDPSIWSYSSLINYILELEAQGYSIHVLIVDYLLMLPTIGCTQGPLGSDKRDLLRRIRSFCSARNITFITPFQLSTEAKQLIRNGVPEYQFVNHIAEKGYYDGCKTIDQELDVELYIHIFSHKRNKYLSIRRGKHRLPTTIPDEDKFYIYKFPGHNIPLIEDLHTNDSSFKTLPKDTEENNIFSEIIN